MTILGLIFFVVLACLAVYVAQKLPAPGPIICYAIVALLCILGMLSLLGYLGPGLVVVR